MDSSAERVAALLLAFADKGADGDHKVSELARAVGRERSQVSRMLHALQRSGLVEQDEETRRYRLGWPLLVLASGAGDTALLRAARPVLRKVVAHTGEVALLSVQQGNRSLTVLREESAQSLRAGGWVGRSSPMHCTASGRALLFDSDDQLVDALTADDLLAPAHGLTGPRTLDELLARLRAERQRGYSLASEEVEIGLTSVGIPVRDPAGDLVAVLNISGPTSRLIPRIDDIARRLRAAAGGLEAALAHPLQSGTR
ncbi:IclR family transcriptional regulator [Streptomyces malaysiensis]|uniref:IclR family transcriptional regulator n=1 Tax=Streptomyces malaysiensis TaxID=92644 RepID=UPI002043558C|nr:IclR family transcriptional regulator [Streptomyces sp. DR7-3]MCM3810670.1 IclR family transcriptional regulator [Streptomyces sp. DR7-3]WPB89874.1 IclR family transcriptional regulator [Streptomyces malaysiensis]